MPGHVSLICTNLDPVVDNPDSWAGTVGGVWSDGGMSVLPDEVADHLDKVVAGTRLPPSTDRVRALDTAVSVLQAGQVEALRPAEIAPNAGIEAPGMTSPATRRHVRRSHSADQPAARFGSFSIPLWIARLHRLGLSVVSGRMGV
jgi:hypothetical protein